MGEREIDPQARKTDRLYFDLDATTSIEKGRCEKTHGPNELRNLPRSVFPLTPFKGTGRAVHPSIPLGRGKGM